MGPLSASGPLASSMEQQQHYQQKQFIPGSGVAVAVAAADPLNHAGPAAARGSRAAAAHSVSERGVSIHSIGGLGPGAGPSPLHGQGYGLGGLQLGGLGSGGGAGLPAGVGRRVPLPPLLHVRESDEGGGASGAADGGTGEAAEGNRAGCGRGSVNEEEGRRLNADKHRASEGGEGKQHHLQQHHKSQHRRGRTSSSGAADAVGGPDRAAARGEAGPSEAHAPAPIVLGSGARGSDSGKQRQRQQQHEHQQPAEGLGALEAHGHEHRHAPGQPGVQAERGTAPGKTKSRASLSGAQGSEKSLAALASAAGGGAVEGKAVGAEGREPGVKGKGRLPALAHPGAAAQAAVPAVGGGGDEAKHQQQRPHATGDDSGSGDGHGSSHRQA